MLQFRIFGILLLEHKFVLCQHVKVAASPRQELLIMFWREMCWCFRRNISVVKAKMIFFNVLEQCCGKTVSPSCGKTSLCCVKLLCFRKDPLLLML